MIDLYSLGATRIVVGLSQVVRVTPSIYQNSFMMQVITSTSGGTLEIVPPVMSGASTPAAGGWGTGYPLRVGNEYAISGPVTFYLAATGVTQTIAMMSGSSQGASII